MSLTVVSTKPQTAPAALLEMVADHIQVATRVTDIDDLRYFNMKDLNEVRVNLYLALELLALCAGNKANKL